MSSLINKIKSWYKSQNKSEISYDKIGINPGKQWAVVLLVTFLVLFILAILAFYLYVEIESGNFFETENKDFLSDVKINNTLLEKVLGDISEREESLVEIRNSKVVPPNPSL